MEPREKQGQAEKQKWMGVEKKGECEAADTGEPSATPRKKCTKQKGGITKKSDAHRNV